jgi:PhzF family phenazine biosynthesis protein
MAAPILLHPVSLLHVDAFTDAPFSGNPAVICLLPPASSDEWKQRLAAEMNLSETAFVERLPATGPTHLFALRWFTPVAEVPLCGHATLASAHALWEENIVPRSAEIVFETLSGKLRANRGPAGITLDFPAIIAKPGPVPADLETALGARIVDFGESSTKLLAELEHEAAIRTLKPDMRLLAALPKEGVIVTARGASGSDADFVSRFFAPKLGVPEDPVTGSSHSILGPWWQAKLGKSEFRARQLSPRGGFMQVRVMPATADAPARVFLTGTAVTVTRGELAIAVETGVAG